MNVSSGVSKVNIIYVRQKHVLFPVTLTTLIFGASFLEMLWDIQYSNFRIFKDFFFYSFHANFLYTCILLWHYLNDILMYPYMDLLKFLQIPKCIKNHHFIFYILMQLEEGNTNEKKKERVTVLASYRRS